MLKSVCLICLEQTDASTLSSNNHCCKRDYCTEKFREISTWERKNFGESFLERLSKDD